LLYAVVAVKSAMQHFLLMISKNSMLHKCAYARNTRAVFAAAKLWLHPWDALLWW
jgi:hypothetical protein